MMFDENMNPAVLAFALLLMDGVMTDEHFDTGFTVTPDGNMIFLLRAEGHPEVIEVHFKESQFGGSILDSNKEAREVTEVKEDELQAALKKWSEERGEEGHLN
jgi:hypothetical protein